MHATDNTQKVDPQEDLTHCWTLDKPHGNINETLNILCSHEFTRGLIVMLNFSLLCVFSLHRLFFPSLLLSPSVISLHLCHPFVSLTCF